MRYWFRLITAIILLSYATSNPHYIEMPFCSSIFRHFLDSLWAMVSMCHSVLALSLSVYSLRHSTSTTVDRQHVSDKFFLSLKKISISANDFCPQYPWVQFCFVRNIATGILIQMAASCARDGKSLLLGLFERGKIVFVYVHCTVVQP